MSLGWDPDVPAGYQDADIEMAELRDAANEAAAEERAKARAKRKARAKVTPECEGYGVTPKRNMPLDDQDFRVLVELIDEEALRLNGKEDHTRVVSLTDLRSRLVETAWNGDLI